KNFLCFLLCFGASLLSFAQEKEDVFHQAQDKVLNAFIASKMDKSIDGLKKQAEEFEAVYKSSKKPLAAYWLAYNRYYTTIFYLMEEEEAKAKATVKEGIALLKELPEKNAEDYALLASLQSISISMYSMFQAISISSKVNKNGQKAMKIDPNCLRAYLVLGSSDYYKPVKYGGGKKVEEYLKKAIALPAQKVANPYLPSWGKNTAYELLIRFYIREEKMEDAKAMYKQAIVDFPEDYQINQLAQKLID
ncbi:MAG: hypothetical protein AAF242_01345, partial [Bacteroidota bacterium]